MRRYYIVDLIITEKHLPMKKFYTAEVGTAEIKNVKETQENTVPCASTIAFLKQFARSYYAVSRAGMPGIVLN